MNGGADDASAPSRHAQRPIVAAKMPSKAIGQACRVAQQCATSRAIAAHQHALVPVGREDGGIA